MVGRMKLGDAPDTIVVAERIRAAWRDLRRAGSTGAVRTYLYEPDAPLDVAQADALDLIVTHAPIRMSEVAALLRVDPSTATRTIAKLQDRTLVVREPDPDDARAILVTPSRAGAVLHRRVRSRANELLIETLDAFSGPDREILADLLERLVEAVDETRFVRDLRPSQTSP